MGYTPRSHVPTCATPTYDPPAGTYSGTQSVTITSAGSDGVFITNNGDTPDISKTLYGSPVNVTGSLTLKGIGIGDGKRNSAVGSAAYTITAPPPDPVIWFAADDLALSDDDPVAAWNGKTPATIDADQANALLQPVFKENIVNSLPVVRFNGTTSRMDMDSATFTECSILFVGKFDGTTNSAFLGSSPSTNFVVPVIGAVDIDPNTGLPSPGQPNTLYAYNGGATVETSEDIGNPNSGFKIYEIVRSGDVCTVKVNGVTKTGFTLAASTAFSALIQLSGTAGANSCINGDLAELKVFASALSAGEMDTERTALATKYGL